MVQDYDISIILINGITYYTSACLPKHWFLVLQPCFLRKPAQEKVCCMSAVIVPIFYRSRKSLCILWHYPTVHSRMLPAICSWSIPLVWWWRYSIHSYLLTTICAYSCVLISQPIDLTLFPAISARPRFLVCIIVYTSVQHGSDIHVHVFIPRMRRHFSPLPHWRVIVRLRWWCPIVLMIFLAFFILLFFFTLFGILVVINSLIGVFFWLSLFDRYWLNLASVNQSSCSSSITNIIVIHTLINRLITWVRCSTLWRGMHNRVTFHAILPLWPIRPLHPIKGGLLLYFWVKFLKILPLMIWWQRWRFRWTLSTFDLWPHIMVSTGSHTATWCAFHLRVQFRGFAIVSSFLINLSIHSLCWCSGGASLGRMTSWSVCVGGILCCGRIWLHIIFVCFRNCWKGEQNQNLFYFLCTIWEALFYVKACSFYTCS